jgi:hypothetical protein
MGKYTAEVDEHLILPACVLLPLAQERDLHRAGLPVPVGVPVRLVIDTGSRRSTLVPSVLASLDPPPGDAVSVETGTGAKATTLFWVRLEFPETELEPIAHLPVARLELPPALRNFHGVIGRDLLFRWEWFRLEGRRRRLSLRDTPSLFSWLGR